MAAEEEGCEMKEDGEDEGREVHNMINGTQSHRSEQNIYQI